MHFIVCLDWRMDYIYIYIYICVCFDILNKKVGKYTGVQHLHFFFFSFLLISFRFTNFKIQAKILSST